MANLLDQIREAANRRMDHQWPKFLTIPRVVRELAVEMFVEQVFPSKSIDARAVRQYLILQNAGIFITEETNGVK